MKYDFIYKDENYSFQNTFELEFESDEPITVLFERDGIILRTDRFGNAIFLNEGGEELMRGAATSESGRFIEVHLVASKDEIRVNFPVIKYIDHYPNCDGEHDRWSKRIVASNYIIFNTTKQVGE